MDEAAFGKMTRFADTLGFRAEELNEQNELLFGQFNYYISVTIPTKIYLTTSSDTALSSKIFSLTGWKSTAPRGRYLKETNNTTLSLLVSFL